MTSYQLVSIVHSKWA